MDGPVGRRPLVTCFQVGNSLILSNCVDKVTAAENAQIVIADVLVTNSVSKLIVRQLVHIDTEVTCETFSKLHHFCGMEAAF